jgi:hypothetical protein
MVPDNTCKLGTAFTVSVDLVGGTTTGISAYDRSATIRALVDPSSRPDDFARPGHVFPLVAKPGGVLRRAGHTEAAVDLARLAGLAPVGVLCEVLDEDGSMARLPRLQKIAKELDLPMVTIADLIAYRRRSERLGRARGIDSLSHRVRRVHAALVPKPGERPQPPGAGQGNRGSQGTGVGARAFAVFHRRRVRLAAV